jgi:hypothetical protein
MRFKYMRGVSTAVINDDQMEWARGYDICLNSGSSILRSAKSPRPEILPSGWSLRLWEVTPFHR